MTHPYKSLPDSAFWSRAVAGVAPEAVNPAMAAQIRIGPGDAVATAGSCFAQQIGGMLQAIGFHHLVTEPAHPLFTPEQAREYGYGLFSARYGNIYTARQLLQLLRRAYGKFHPAEDCWGEGAPGSTHSARASSLAALPRGASSSSTAPATSPPCAG